MTPAGRPLPVWERVLQYLASYVRLLVMHTESLRTHSPTSYLLTWCMALSWLLYVLTRGSLVSYANIISLHTFGTCYLLVASTGRCCFSTRPKKHGRGVIIPVPVPHTSTAAAAAAEGKRITTIFFAGNGNDSSQAIRYVGQDGLRLPWWWYRWTFQGSTRLLVNLWNETDAAANPPDTIRPWRANCAQDEDVAAAVETLRRAFAARPRDRIVLFGTSRGSAVVLRAVNALTPEEVKAHIAFVVCEALFDSAVRVLHDRLPWYNARYAVIAALHKFTAFRIDYKHTPLVEAQCFQHLQLPILVVTSLADTVVRPERTKAMVDAMRKRGCENVYYATLNRSAHSSYSCDYAEDQETYSLAMQRMYNEYV